MELKGVGVSPGIAVGPALVMEREAVPVFRLLVPPERAEAELARLHEALAASRRQLTAIKQRLAQEVGTPHAYIFDAQLLMLEDPLLLDRAEALVRGEQVNAEWALRTVSDELHALFDGFSDEYLRERSTDLDDVLGRIQLNLAGIGDAPSLNRLPGSCVLVADDLTPSEAAELDWERVLAVAIDAGSQTYHTAILARSLGIPAVAGLQDATRRVPPGSLLVVDGTNGLVAVEPSGPALLAYRKAQERDRNEERKLQQTRGLPAVTLDGLEVRLQANAEFPEEAATALQQGAAGIGLFRSEYLLARSRSVWPDEEEQVAVYRRLLEAVRPHPVTVRAWDVGSEHLDPEGPTAPNPALGERALRLLKRDPGPFLTQMRALLRAAVHGPLRLMLPFVSGPGDLRPALALIEEARESLRREGRDGDAELPVGIIVEVPSAALTADLLAREVDFLSVGTNDLIQYLLAVDRADPRVSSLYQPLHPAVLRTIRQVVDAGERWSVPVAVCGEMAADPLQACLLLGLGVRELSMRPGAIPRVKAALRAVSGAQAREVATACLGLATSAEIEALALRELGAVAPAIVEE